MEVSTKPGIYCFTNSVNGKCYVGQAVNLRNRYNSHIGNFKAHRYDNPLYREHLLNMDWINLLMKC